MTVNTEDEKLEKLTPEIKAMKPPQHGGRRPGAGRKKGTPNIMTRELKEICRQEAPVLVKELIRLATGCRQRG
jgi:hypothetical protein